MRCKEKQRLQSDHVIAQPYPCTCKTAAGCNRATKPATTRARTPRDIIAQRKERAQGYSSPGAPALHHACRAQQKRLFQLGWRWRWRRRLPRVNRVLRQKGGNRMKETGLPAVCSCLKRYNKKREVMNKAMIFSILHTLKLFFEVDSARTGDTPCLAGLPPLLLLLLLSGITIGCFCCCCDRCCCCCDS
jgi:hypothetical protein